MAGERKGKTYEALFLVALKLALKTCEADYRIFWNESPEGVKVEPDFSLGVDKDHPSVVFMVTHIGASSAAQKKCWRNMGELCEIKTVVTPSPVAINVIFDSSFKEEWKKLQEAAFDGQLIIGDTDYGRELLKWVRANDAHLPKSQEERASFIEQLLKHDLKLKENVDLLAKDIAKVLNHSQSHMNSLWTYEQQRQKGTAPSARTTYFRRGMCKLLVFPDVDQAVSLYKDKRLSTEIFPDYIYIANLAKRGIGHAIPSDPEIMNALSLTTTDNAKNIYHSIDNNEVLKFQIDTIRNTDSISRMAAYVISNYDELCQPEEMLARINQLHEDKNALIENAPISGWPPADVWLVSFLMHLFRAATNSATGYGISQLGADVVAAGYGDGSDLASASQFGGGFGFTAWLMRKPTPFKAILVEGVAYVLATKLASLAKSRIVTISNSITEAIINNTIEARICIYRDFYPLQLLLEYGGVVSSVYDTENIRSCFAEQCALGGQTGNSTVYHVKNTIINWQSAYAGHPADKKKELSGRAVGLRYTWETKRKAFIPRPGVKKLILLLDGTWQQQHLDSLVSAGWDEIYYPDEIDKLKAAIV